MMHRSKKPLVSGDREYFNEKRPVNVRVDGTAHLAEALGVAPKRGSRKWAGLVMGSRLVLTDDLRKEGFPVFGSKVLVNAVTGEVKIGPKAPLRSLAI
jgi:hypothetical protein